MKWLEYGLGRTAAGQGRSWGFSKTVLDYKSEDLGVQPPAAENILLVQNFADCFYYNCFLRTGRTNAQLLQYYSWKPDPEARSSSQSNRCLVNAMGSGSVIPLPSIQPDWESTEQDPGRGSQVCMPHRPNMAWYPQLLSMLVSSPVTLGYNYNNAYKCTMHCFTSRLHQ